MAEAQPQKPKATLISSSQNLSSNDFTNQFISEPAKVNLSDILKALVKPEVQSMVDVPVKQATPAALRTLLVDTIVTMIPEITTTLPTQPPPTQPKTKQE
ncbi:hypothetical protein Tco_1500654 [Tanacetum coccineum]